MKKLLIWGTGEFAKRFIENKYHGEIIGFIETEKYSIFYAEAGIWKPRDSERI